MTPVFKDYLWGGTRLRDEFNKKTDLPVVAESWEVSCHPDGLSTIGNGVLTGQTLDSVLKLYPAWMGSQCAGMTEFPLLIKLIDARDKLSLQVHPDDEYARRVERQAGKNEMWYIAGAQPESELILGFKTPLSMAEMRTVLTGSGLLPAVRRVTVHAGDCYCIPAGLLHAIGSGISIVEVQQSSNVTYRVYDYARKDSAGNSRELHLDKAIDVIDPTLRANNATGNILADWRFFRSELLVVDGYIDSCCEHESFQCLVIVDGELSLICGDHELLLRKGETVFMPAGIGKYVLNGPARAVYVSAASNSP